MVRRKVIWKTKCRYKNDVRNLPHRHDITFSRLVGNAESQVRAHGMLICFACSTSEFEFVFKIVVLNNLTSILFFFLDSKNGLVDWRKKVATIRVKISKEFSFVLKDIEGNFCLKIEFSLVKEFSLS